MRISTRKGWFCIVLFLSLSIPLYHFISRKYIIDLINQVLVHWKFLSVRNKYKNLESLYLFTKSSLFIDMSPYFFIIVLNIYYPSQTLINKLCYIIQLFQKYVITSVLVASFYLWLR